MEGGKKGGRARQGDKHLTDLPPAIVQSLPDQYYAVIRAQRPEDRGDLVMLIAHALAETNLKPAVENAETGAAGPYQFLGSTWLDLVYRHGRSLGIKAALVDRLALDADGRARAADPVAEHDVLALRHDLVLATRMANRYVADSRRSMEQQLGRPPAAAEVELSLLLGPTGASRLVAAAREQPQRPASDVVPGAVASNASLFRDERGGIRSAGDAVRVLIDRLVDYRGRIFTALAGRS